MALPFSHDHPPRSAQPSSSSSSSQLLSSPPATSSSSLGSLADGQAYVRGCHHPSARPTRHQGLVEVGITDSPHSCHSRDQLYRQIRQSPIPPPGINLEKTHPAAFSFFVKCYEALRASPISGWNQLCIVFHCFFPPPLYLERVLFYMVCECWKDNICFLCHLARAALRNSPRDKYFQSKHE